MRIGAKTTIAVCSGAAVVALSAGLGGFAGAVNAGTPGPTVQTVTATAPAGSTHLNRRPQSGVHVATLTGCIPGMDC